MPFHQAYVSIEQPAIGFLVRELRQALKRTQEKFAAQLGVTFPTINRWENRHTVPYPLALKQVDGLLKQLNDPLDLTLQGHSKALQIKYFLQRDVEE